LIKKIEVDVKQNREKETENKNAEELTKKKGRGEIPKYIRKFNIEAEIEAKKT
jgi:hypothetical protein